MASRADAGRPRGGPVHEYRAVHGFHEAAPPHPRVFPDVAEVVR